MGRRAARTEPLGLLLLVGACAAAACAGSPSPQPQAASPPPPASSAVEPVAEPVADPLPSEPPSEPATALEPAEPAPAEGPQSASESVEQVAQACSKLCARARDQCSRRSARTCQANCDRYVGIAGECGTHVLEALSCQASVPGLICSNVVGECAQAFGRLAACETGQPPKPQAKSDAPPAPAGWNTLESPEHGFRVALPKLVTASREQGHPIWRVQDESGVSYVVSVMPPFEGEVNDKSIVRKVLVLLGHDCQRDMKIHGRFEAGDKTAVRFDSRCRDGTAWHGMLRISNRNVVMTAEVVPPGKTGQGDGFYFSFAYLS